MISKIYSLSASLLLLLFVLNCKVSESEAIVKGEKALPGEFPSIVSLRNETGKHYCGGTLVTRKHVVTAAHCTYKDDLDFHEPKAGILKPENIKVVAGTLSRVQGGDTYEVETFILHPDYDVKSELFLKYDVAVIVLKKEVNTENVVPTPISTTIPKEETSGKVGGWGVLSLNENQSFMQQNNFPTDLQKLSVVIKDKATCKNKFKNDKLAVQQINTEFVICAQSDVEGSGICVRDSGSPFIVNGELVGHVIGGSPCANNKPDFFAPTATYQDFINGVINSKA